MKLTLEDYRDAVTLLLNTAKGDTSGSRAAAQVLLSCYNGSRWQLDITDLSVMDRHHYLASLTTIRGRIELFEEPHKIIEDGGQKFAELCDKWKWLNVKERGKTSCGEGIL